MKYKPLLIHFLYSDPGLVEVFFQLKSEMSFRNNPLYFNAFLLFHSAHFQFQLHLENDHMIRVK